VDPLRDLEEVGVPFDDEPRRLDPQVPYVPEQRVQDLRHAAAVGRRAQVDHAAPVEEAPNTGRFRLEPLHAPVAHERREPPRVEFRQMHLCELVSLGHVLDLFFFVRTAIVAEGSAYAAAGCGRSSLHSATGPPSTSGLGHHPFKVAARVRIPLGASPEAAVPSGSRGAAGTARGSSRSARSRRRAPTATGAPARPDLSHTSGLSTHTTR
jgi:hypothetical protein